MRWLRTLYTLFRNKELDSDMTEEMRLHIELQTELNLKAGMAPGEARFAALRQFGNVAEIQERAREVRGTVWLEQLLQDVRHALRSLTKSPGFTLTAIFSLALGIGVNTAIFSVVNDVLLKSLPVRNPGELVLLQWARGAQGTMVTAIEGNSRTDPVTKRTTSTSFSMPVFERMRASHPGLSHLFAYTPISRLNVLIDGEPQINVSGQFVSGEYYTGLGVTALLGRTLGPEDDLPGAIPVLVISHRFWMTRLGQDAAVLGKTVRLNKIPFTVVGVTPPEFNGALDVGESADVSVPLALHAELQPDETERMQPGFWWLRGVMGRLAPGATAAQVSAALEGPFQEMAREAWKISQSQRQAPSAEVPDPPQLEAVAGRQGLTVSRDEYVRPFGLIMGLVGLVLLIACANVANLLLARGALRRREIAVRLALGAGRGRVIRHLLVESLLLALAGALAGTGLAALARNALITLLPLGGSFAPGLPFSWPVLGFTFGVALLTSLGAGLVPALRATRLDLHLEFQGGTRTPGGSPRSRLSQALMAVQIALSVVLLVCTGLFVRTLDNLRNVDPGFNRAQLVLFSLDLNSAGYNPAQFADFHGRILERLRQVPGVQSAAYSALPLLSRSQRNQPVSVQGYVTPPGTKRAPVMTNVVSADFFPTMEMPLVLGRGFTGRDDKSGQKVVVINQTMAVKYFGTGNPVGRRLGFGGPSTSGDVEIVGVVRDAKYGSLRGTVQGTAYTSALQSPPGLAHYNLRVAGQPEAIFPAVRTAVRELDSTLPVLMLRTMDEQIDRLHAPERLFARVSGLFGLLAVVLACVGLHGLLAYIVLHRTGEIGIRMALGAQPGQVLRLILRESLGLAGIGVVVGLGLAVAITRLFATMLYGLSPNDPVVYGAVALLLLGIALLASWLPARRAAKVDPMVALRAE